MIPRNRSLLVLSLVCAFSLYNLFTAMGNRGSGDIYGPPVVMGDESLMAPKEHGTCEKGPLEKLKWGVKSELADRICTANRHYAEHSGYAFEKETTSWLAQVDRGNPVEYFDSIFGDRMFTAPMGRTFEEFILESRKHGWPSFRDAEVDWENVRILPGGEAVSTNGVHLGHNIPDKDEQGNPRNRYCINLCCIAGDPESVSKKE